VDLYRRLGETTTPAQLEVIREELEDTYGELPEPARNLLALHALRMECERLRISRALLRVGSAKLTFSEETPASADTIAAWVARDPHGLKMEDRGGALRILQRWESPEEALDYVRQLLVEL